MPALPDLAKLMSPSTSTDKSSALSGSASTSSSNGSPNTGAFGIGEDGSGMHISSSGGKAGNTSTIGGDKRIDTTTKLDDSANGSSVPDTSANLTPSGGATTSSTSTNGTSDSGEDCDCKDEEDAGADVGNLASDCDSVRGANTLSTRQVIPSTNEQAITVPSSIGSDNQASLTDTQGSTANGNASIGQTTGGTANTLSSGGSQTASGNTTLQNNSTNGASSLPSVGDTDNSTNGAADGTRSGKSDGTTGMTGTTDGSTSGTANSTTTGTTGNTSGTTKASLDPNAGYPTVAQNATLAAEQAKADAKTQQMLADVVDLAAKGAGQFLAAFTSGGGSMMPK